MGKDTGPSTAMGMPPKPVPHIHSWTCSVWTDLGTYFFVLPLGLGASSRGQPSILPYFTLDLPSNKAGDSFPGIAMLPSFFAPMPGLFHCWMLCQRAVVLAAAPMQKRKRAGFLAQLPAVLGSSVLFAGRTVI